MTKKQRESVFERLTSNVEFGEGWVKASEIDKFGLAKALRLGVARALRQLKVAEIEEIIIDGKVNYIAKKYKNGQVLVGADNSVPIVSAASIYAKVTRDKFMVELAKKHPSYYFEKHFGYGTKQHLEAIKLNGAIKFVHRYSYKPVAQIAGAL